MPLYALFYLLAIAGGCGAIYLEGRRRGFGADRWTMCVAAWAIGGIAGAVAPQLLLGELAATRTAVGAVAGATLALFITAALLRVPTDRALDATAVAIPIGGALARLGCFVAECCEGLATSLPIGIVGEEGIRRHPTQLYEAVFDTAIAIWLSRSATRMKDGHRFLASLGLLSAGRFAIEFVRESDRIGPLSLAQWIVAPVALMCLLLVARNVGLPRIMPAPSRMLALGGIGFVAVLAAAGRLGPLEVSAIGLATIVSAGVIAARNGRLVPAGAAALMLQMPAPADSAFPQRFSFWGFGLGGGGYTLYHDDSTCDSGPYAEWSRFHKYYGGSVEGGYLRQGGPWSGITTRGRLSYSLDHADRAIVTQGSLPNPRSYTTENISAGVFIDLTGKYAALTLGGTLGVVRPAISGIFEEDEDPMRAWLGYPGIGLRLGPLFGPSIEARIGDESPLNVAMPMFTIGVAGGDSKGNRIRVGVSDGGYFASATLKRAKGLDIMPSFHVFNGERLERHGGGVAVRQWRKLPTTP